MENFVAQLQHIGLAVLKKSPKTPRTHVFVGGVGAQRPYYKGLYWALGPGSGKLEIRRGTQKVSMSSDGPEISTALISNHHLRDHRT